MNARGGAGGRPRSNATPVVIQPRLVVQVVGWVVVGLVALLVLERSRHVLELVLLSVVIAVLLKAPIDRLSRGLPRWSAVVVVVIGSIVATAGVLALGTVQLGHEIDVVGAAVTERLDQIDPDSALGEFLADGTVVERIERQLDQLPSQIFIGSPEPADGARVGLEALLVVVLMVYCLVNGPGLARALLGGSAPTWWAGHVRDGVAAGAVQVRRLLGLAIANGVLALVTSWVFGVPGTSVLAIWAGVWSVVPIFGPIVGYLPIVVVASLDGWPQVVGTALVASVATVGSWYADRHGVTSGSAGVGARLGPLGLTVALVTGLRFGWLAGPLVVVFLAAASLSTLAALGRRDRSRLLADQVAPDTGATTRSTVLGRLEWRSAARTTAIVVVAVAAIAIVIGLAPVPVWVIVGVTVSIALEPLVDWIADRTPLGRGAAVGAVVVGVLVVVGAMLVFAVPSVASNVRELDDQLPTIAADLEQLPIIGDELAERGVAERLQTTFEELPTRLSSDTGALEGALRSAGDGLVATFWIVLVTVTALIDGRRVQRGLRSLVAPEHGDEFDRVDTIVRRVVARYAVGSVVIAAIAGSAAFTIAVIGGVPLAVLIGLWAALTNFIPQIGGYLGAVPLVVLGFTTGATNGLVITAVYLVYMQIENRLIQPLIVSRAVDVSPLVAMVAVLVAGAAAGAVGAVLVTPLVAVATTLRREFRPPSPLTASRATS